MEGLVQFKYLARPLDQTDKMYGDMPDHQEGVESLGTTGEDATERGGGYAGVIYVLQGGIPGGTYIWIVAVGCVRINVEDGGGY